MKYPVQSLLLVLIFLCFSSSQGKAQSNGLYSYNELSHLYYASLKDSIKKNWNCPVIFKNKETQKKYKEFWDSRSSVLLDAISAKNFIHDKELYDYVGSIVNQIHRANKDLIPQTPRFFIDRSSSVNAYAAGGNFIAINLGLIAFSNSREELALAIAHELSHNILDHSDNSMKERAELVTSEEYKKNLESILDSKFERYTRLKKVLEGYTFNRSRHNRYHEGDADSLAIILLKKSGISFDAKFFTRLDSADSEYKQPLKRPVEAYFKDYNLPFNAAWTVKRTRGLSTRNHNFNDTSVLADSLKMHPDCQERYANTIKFTSPKVEHTAIPQNLKSRINKMIIWNMFDGLSLTACLYRVFLEKDSGNKDEWYDFMLYNIFAGLKYSDNELNRFNAVRIMSKEYISTNYYQLQTMLEQIPREDLETYCGSLKDMGFWNKLSPDEKALRGLFATLIDKNSTPKDKESAAKSFNTSYTNSLYCEFSDHFIK